jgi:hypothetical protein
MTNEQRVAKRIAELKESEKKQKDLIKQVKKEHKSTISKLKRSCQTKTKKHNKEMVKLREKTLKLKLEKEDLVGCEDLLNVKIKHSKREIERHENNLYTIQEKIAQLMD